MKLLNGYLLTGKVLTLSHLSSNINMASEIRTLMTCLEYFVMLSRIKKKKPKGHGSTLEEMRQKEKYGFLKIIVLLNF